MSLKSNDKCLYKREAAGYEAERREGHMTMEAEVGMMYP